MNKQKLTIIIICTVLAMALVAVSLVMWLVPGDKNQGKLPGETTVLTTQEETETTANTETVITTDPAETTAATETTEPTQTEATNPTKPSKPTEPKPTEPKPTEPKPTEPKPTEPKPTEPKPTTPEPTISVEIEEETEPVNEEKDDNFEIDFDDLLGL